jgi:hypothetical protein
LKEEVVVKEINIYRIKEEDGTGRMEAEGLEEEQKTRKGVSGGSDESGVKGRGRDYQRTTL